MDKYEYGLKLDQMKDLVMERDYQHAAQIADEINWNKVRNINTLCMVGKIYEKMDRLDDARDVYHLAYDRSPNSKNALFRLTRLAIRQGNAEDAETYYDYYIKNAPRDRGRYILAYQLSCMKNEPIANQIRLLEELKGQEYMEEWAYELARLYAEDGQFAKCIEACDELELWFGEGEYVRKALELKRGIRPLSPSQEEKYQLLCNQELQRARQAAKKAEEAQAKPDEAAAIASAAAGIAATAAAMPEAENEKAAVTESVPAAPQTEQAEAVQQSAPATADEVA